MKKTLLIIIVSLIGLSIIAQEKTITLSTNTEGTPASDLWVTSDETMPEASYLGSSAYNTDDNLLYAIGGALTENLFIYDVENDLWSSGATLPAKSVTGSAVYTDGIVYANQGEGASGFTDVFWAYDTSSDSWSVKQSMPEALAWGDMTYCDIHNAIYFVAGSDGDFVYKNTVYRYDIASDTWDSATSLPELKAGGKIVYDNETLYYIAGLNQDFSLSNKVFKGEINPDDPLDISWSIVSELPVAVFKHHVANFGRGKLIVNGGNDADGGNYQSAIPSTFIYDINDDTWTQVADKTMAVNAGACGTFQYDGITAFVVASGYNGTDGIKYAEMFITDMKHIISYEVIGENGAVSATIDGNPVTTGEEATYGSEVVFTATPDDGYSVKEWIVNGTAQSETGNVFIYSSLDQDINVTVEFQEGSSVENISNDNIKAFPNPFRNEIKISNTNDLCRIRIDNLVGVKILELETNGDIIINTADLAAGVYFITFIFNDNSQTVRKMIKQ